MCKMRLTLLLFDHLVWRNLIYLTPTQFDDTLFLRNLLLLLLCRRCRTHTTVISLADRYWSIDCSFYYFSLSVCWDTLSTCVGTVYSGFFLSVRIPFTIRQRNCKNSMCNCHRSVIPFWRANFVWSQNPYYKQAISWHLGFKFTFTTKFHSPNRRRPRQKKTTSYPNQIDI